MQHLPRDILDEICRHLDDVTRRLASCACRLFKPLHRPKRHDIEQYAARSVQLSRWFIMRGVEVNRIMDKAIEMGHIEVFIYTRSIGEYVPGEDISPAYYGHLTMLSYVGCAGLEYICSEAAQSERLSVLEYAIHQGCPWDMQTCHEVAMSGCLSMLMYARRHSFWWDSNTCGAAAYMGDFQMLTWALWNGCPSNRIVRDSAAYGGRLSMMAYIMRKDFPWNHDVLYSNRIWLTDLSIIMYEKIRGQQPFSEYAANGVAGEWVHYH